MEDSKAAFNIFQLLNDSVFPIVKKSKKWLILAPVVAAVFFWVGYSKENKKLPVFSAQITYMLEDDINTSSPKMAGGELLMALSGQPVSSNKNIMVDLSLSNKLVEETLLSLVKPDSTQIVLANYYIDHCGPMKNWIENKNAEQIKMRFPKNYVVGTDKKMDYWLRAFSNAIKLSLKTKVKESGLISMDYSCNDEQFTKMFLDNHLRTISDFYIDKKVERAINLVQLTKRKKDSLLAILQGKSYGLANQMDKTTFGVVMKRAKVPEMQLNRDLEIANEQYGQSMLAMSTASLDLERNRPFISIVDDIRLPLESVWPAPVKKGIFLGIIGFILTLAVIVGAIFGKDYIVQQKKDFELIKK